MLSHIYIGIGLICKYLYEYFDLIFFPVELNLLA